MEEKAPRVEVHDEKESYNRRKIMKGGAGIGAAAVVPGMAAADDLDGTSSSAASSNGVETELITESDEYQLFRTNSGDRISLGKMYTEGPKEGKLEIVTLDEGNEIETLKTGTEAGVYRTSSPDKVSTDETAALSAVETNGLEIVERSKNINRSLDNCGQDYCDGFTYTHVQTGFSVEFTDVIDAFGKSVIAEAISILAETYVKARWARWVGSFASIIAGTLLSIATGAEYTVSPWDQDKGWIFTNPVVELGVSGGWDTHAHDLTNIQDNERAHIGSLDGRCG